MHNFSEYHNIDISRSIWRWSVEFPHLPNEWWWKIVPAEGRGRFAFCVIVAALFSPMRQAGKFRSAPRNWLGKDLAYHCLDDLYTSPVHPHPPAWWVHLLLHVKGKTQTNLYITGSISIKTLKNFKHNIEFLLSPNFMLHLQFNSNLASSKFPPHSVRPKFTKNSRMYTDPANH